MRVFKGLIRFRNVNSAEDAVRFFVSNAKSAGWSEVEIEKAIKQSGYPDAHPMSVISFFESYFY